MNTGLYIAFRYLFSRKSHNVINVISAISAVGMAVGTAALILILSIYNGFDKIIEDNMSDLTPDLFVSSKEGAYFSPNEDLLQTIEKACPDSASISPVLTSKVFCMYNGNGSIATAVGIDPSVAKNHPVSNHITGGEFTLKFGSLPCACIGAGLAHELGINPRFVEKIELYYPRNGESLPLFGYNSYMRKESLVPKGIFSINSESDNMIILPLETLRTLLGREESEISGIEIRLPKESLKKVRKSLTSAFGEEFDTTDRYGRHPSIYRMMRYEKLAIYLILIFVVLTISVNLFGSLSMLIIEKEDDMKTLGAMGADGRLKRRIFTLEGLLITLFGLLSGLVAGIAMALIQQHFGVLKMPQGLFVSAYPCILQANDVVATFFGVLIIGFGISCLAARRRE